MSYVFKESNMEEVSSLVGASHRRHDRAIHIFPVKAGRENLHTG